MGGVSAEPMVISSTVGPSGLITFVERSGSKAGLVKIEFLCFVGLSFYASEAMTWASLDGDFGRFFLSLQTAFPKLAALENGLE